MKRNFIRGLMDGSLTTLGVIIASFNNPEVLAVVGLGVAVANSLSNACGGYISEKTLHIERHRVSEKAMLISNGLANTLHMTKAEVNSLKRGLADSLGTFIGALVPLSCVLFISGIWGLYIGTIIPVSMYIALGVWMGLLSKEHLAVSVAKTTLFAIATVILTNLIRIYV